MAPRSCTSKRRYETLDDAECKGVRIYFCTHCSGFHRTTKPIRAWAVYEKNDWTPTRAQLKRAARRRKRST